RFGRSRHPLRGLRHGDNTAPRPGHRKSRQQRTHRATVLAMAAFEDEAAAIEDPRADRRSFRAADGDGERARIGWKTVKLRQRAADGKTELRAGTKSRMSGKAARDPDGHTRGDAVMVEESTGEPLRAFRVVAARRQQGRGTHG